MGVHPETLRRWEKQGKIVVERTPTGFRRYDLAKLRGPAPHKAPSTRTTLLYARVSSHDQKDDLARQVVLLESFAAANGWTYEVLQDLGSGLNYHKKGLRQLIRRICSDEVGRLVLTHKDRLLRFGSELVFALCEHFGKEVVRFVRKTLRRALGKPPRVHHRRSFALDSTLYRVFEHNGRQYVSVATLTPRKRCRRPNRSWWTGRSGESGAR